MDALTELAWTLAAIATIDLAFLLWLAARDTKRDRGRAMVSSAELLASRTRRGRG